jgi:hypothetical protein
MVTKKLRRKNYIVEQFNGKIDSQLLYNKDTS